MKQLNLLFGLKERVSRKPYILWGVSLMVLKYLGELLLYYLATHEILSPLNFLSPIFNSRYPGAHQDWFVPAIVLWTIPYVWIGVSMSIRRAADANFSPWIGLFFFVPILNFVLMAVLCIASTSEVDNWHEREISNDTKIYMPPVAITLGFAVLGVILSWVSTNVLAVYASSLFVGAPFVLGLVQSYLLNYKTLRTVKSTVGYVLLTVVLIHLMLLLVALEGVICLLMSFPIAASLALLGTLLGIAIARYGKPSRLSPSLLVLALPLMPIAESAISIPHEDVVLSVTEIDAPPEKVWPNVVSFSDLPPTNDWLFKLGVAHPLRARIDGHGVGAVRHCEFSTGAFVEPITNWEEPHRLAFSVKYQPQPMKELSFYDHVDAPHLNGYFRSVRGEFQLIPLPNGKTRLEGRTWYQVDIHPGWYWQMYGRWFIHKIHLRVLNHIKSLTETT
jgi:hypothetical protein